MAESIPVRKLWSVQDVSDYLGIPIMTLYQWRSKRYGPPARRMGRYLRYRPAEVEAWINGLDDQAVA